MAETQIQVNHCDITQSKTTGPRDLDLVFANLAKSKFRQRFKLGQKERQYLAEKEMPTVLSHARDFIAVRLAPAIPPNDGKQTPMRGHPVFIAQHATATCCRTCLVNWHRIIPGHQLSSEEQEHVIQAIERWLTAQTS